MSDCLTTGVLGLGGAGGRAGARVLAAVDAPPAAGVTLEQHWKQHQLHWKQHQQHWNQQQQHWKQQRQQQHLVVESCLAKGQLTEAVHAFELLVVQEAEEEEELERGRPLIHGLVQCCSTQRNVLAARRLHALAVWSGCHDAFVANHLMAVYAGAGRVQEAALAFEDVEEPDVHMWATIISAHARHGQPSRAMELYSRMRRDFPSVKPDNHVFVAALKACGAARDLSAVHQLHAHLPREGHLDVFVANCLLDVYAKCGSLEDARKVFDGVPADARDVVTWTSMMAGYAQQGMGQEALRLYAVMQQHRESVKPNLVTFVCLLQACAGVGDLRQAKLLHAHIIQEQERQPEHEEEEAAGRCLRLGNCLVDCYAKCGSLGDARRVFDALPTRDVVTWTAMIAGYARQGHGEEALWLYARMQQQGMAPAADHVTFVCLLQACASMGPRALQQGLQLHEHIRDRGLLHSHAQLGNCLVDMYAKCGSLERARSLFHALLTRDVCSWTALIAGYAQQGLGREALCLYASMQEEGVTLANHVTFVCLLQACAGVGALHQGRLLHADILQTVGLLEGHVEVGNSLVDMYAKCGRLEDAHRLFQALPTRNVVTWNALLNGLAEHCDAGRAVSCFQSMLHQGVEPNENTFTCLLVACSRAGLVDEGQLYFREMVEEHGIVPQDHHYNCMVDLLGRSGRLDEAQLLLATAPLRDFVVGWTCLLTACRSHGDAERGRRCFHHLVGLEPDNATAYVLLANIFADAGKWEEVDRIESMRKCAGASKKPAVACIEVKKEVHEFRVGEERCDSPSLKRMNMRWKEDGGHVPHTHLVLKAAASEQDKEDALCGHAEKLALAYGLLNTPSGTSLLVTKNLRMCHDCHSSTKAMSHVEKRDITVRDLHRIHHFVNGSCSCEQ